MTRTHKTIIALIAFVAMAIPATAQEVVPFTDYLPDDTLVVISVPQTAELKAFLERPEIKRLLDIVMDQPEFAEGFAEFKQKFHEKTGITTKELYDRLDGDMTIAMLSFPITHSGVPDMVVTFGMRGGSAGIANDLNRVMAAAQEEGKEVKKLSIAGHDVYGISEEDAFFAEAHGHFMIASTTNAVERFFGDGPRLNSSPGFNRHRELVGLNEGISVYVNFGPFNDMLNAAISADLENNEDSKSQAAMAVVNEMGLDKINGISLTVPLRSDSSARMFIHAPGYDGFFAKIFSTEAIDRALLTGLDAKTDSLAAFTLQKPDSIMNYFVDLMMEFNPNMTPEMFEGLLQQFKEQTGVDVRNDLIASLGTNIAFGFHLKEGASLDFARNPFAMFDSFEFDLLWQLTNRAGLESALSGLMAAVQEQMPDAFVSEMYKGAAIHNLAWGMPGASFSMAVHDGYMRMATRSTDNLKGLIDGLTGDANVAATMGFRNAMKDIPTAACMISYVSPDYYRKYVEASISMLPETTEDMPEPLAKFMTVLKDGARKVAAKGRSYSGYALPMADGLFAEGEIDLADQLYIFMLEMTKYYMISQSAVDYEAPTASN